MKKKILFVCIENAGRSQMAEGFFRKYAPEGYEPCSAGTQPVDVVNPLVIEAMKEAGIDLSMNSPKRLIDSIIQDSYKIVNMGCMGKEACPALFVQQMEDWSITDPKGKSIVEIRKIRDDIERKVKELCKILN